MTKIALSKGVAWALSNVAGITAILVIVGYVIRITNDRLTGFSVDVPSASTYVTLATGLLWEMVVAVFRWPVWAYAISSVAIVCLGSRLCRSGWGLGCKLTLLILLALTKAILFDVPAFYLKSVLLSEPALEQSFGSSEGSVVGHLATELWKDFYCSHQTGCTECARINAAYYKEEFRVHFGFEVTLFLLIVLFTSLAAEDPALKSLGGWGQSSVLAFITLVVITSAYLLVLRYGKIIYSDAAQAVSIYTVDSGDFETGPKLSKPNGTSKIQKGRQGLLVSRDDAGVYLLETDRFSLTYIPYGDIQKIEYLQESAATAIDAIVQKFGSCREADK